MTTSKLLPAAYSSTAISAAGLSANRQRLNIAASNLANAESVGYRRRDIFLTAKEIPSVEGSFSAALDRKTLMAPSVAAVIEDSGPQRMQYQPNHPMANAAGYVEMPNVNVVETMTDMMSASRLYEANAEAFKISQDMSSEGRKILSV